MTRFLHLELRRYSTTAIYLSAATASSLLIALYFFAIIGRFDDSTDSAMFHNYSSIVALGLTISLFVIVVYGAAIYARFIVTDYMGNRRIQLYTYPAGRSPLFLAKNTAYVIATSAAALVGVILAGTIFFISEALSPIVAVGGEKGHLSTTVITGLASIILLAASIVLIAGTIGVFQGSTITTIVSAIVLIAVLGNGIAISLANTAWLTAVIAVGCTVLAIGVLAAQTKRIQNDEVL